MFSFPGCLGLGGGKAPPSLLSLTPAKSAPAGAVASGTGATAIMVMEPDTDKRLAVQRVPVQVSASSIAYLKSIQTCQSAAVSAVLAP